MVREAQIYFQAKDDVDDDDDEDKDADDDEEKGPGENRRDSIASEASDTTVSIQLSHDSVTNGASAFSSYMIQTLGPYKQTGLA